MANNYRILLVEDDHYIRTLMEEVLTGEGYQLTSVQNGMEAVKTLARNDFHLLITDFRMPHLNGVELLKWCRDHYLRLPVIFMTATAHLLNEEDSALHEFDATLVHKPLNLDHFLAKVKRLLIF